jgi:hypothetical protein
MNNLWQSYYQKRSRPADTEEDLYLHVQHTINGQPISRNRFSACVSHVVTRLELAQHDTLMDFCCGNGLFTYEFASYAGSVWGTDFVEEAIVNANQWKKKSNITYIDGDVTSPLSHLIGVIQPNKFLMHYSLAYLKPNDLDNIVTNILTHLSGRPFMFLVVGIPRADRKWNYYDTPERRTRYLENETKVADFNDGLGRWWQPEELEAVSLKNSLRIEIKNQPAELYNYRMDALLWSA